MVGGHLEIIWEKKKNEWRQFGENRMSLEAPVQELGIMLEIGRKWGKEAESAL